MKIEIFSVIELKGTKEKGIILGKNNREYYIEIINENEKTKKYKKIKKNEINRILWEKK